MVRGTAFLILAAACIRAPAILAQTEPSFEVATIKPSIPGQPGYGMSAQGRRFITVNTSLRDLIAFAYGVHPGQIVGGPAWVGTGEYDLYAEADGGRPANSQPWKAMVQTLMADRFHLAFHHAAKEFPLYAIMVAKSGPKFTDSRGNPNANATYSFPSRGTMVVHDATISDFAGWMERYVTDRPVVDRTEITGKYDFNLSWRPDDAQFPDLAGLLPPGSGADQRPDLYTAIQQQLGLKLKSAKGSVDILVIDRAERPSAN